MSDIPIFEFRRDEFVISTDLARLDLGIVQHWLSTASYWAEGVSLDVVERGFRHSCVFAAYDKAAALVGWSRVVTDYATYGYLTDVFVLPERRGQGLGKLLVEAMLAHPALQGFKKLMLGTRDAHGLYRQYGFEPVRNPLNQMERRE